MNNNPLVQGDGFLHFKKKPRRKLTVEVITERLEGRNITLLSYGGGTLKKPLWKCCVCEHEWSARTDHILRGSGCPGCSGNAPLTIKTITGRLEGRNITLLSYGGSALKKSQWKCCICEYEWSAIASSILTTGSGCPACAGLARLTVEVITERLEGRDIALLSYGGSALKKSQWKCCICEYEWSAIASNVLNQGKGCPACAEYGYKSSLPGTLYALRSDCGRYVKIGITNNFKQRFSKLKRVTPFDVSVIERIECDGQTASKLEKMFHREFESAGFMGFDGATEWLRWSAEIQHWLRLLKC